VLQRRTDGARGDLLVQIDPRPYEVELATCEAQMGKDQAALNNARVDLTRYQNVGGRKTRFRSSSCHTAGAGQHRMKATIKSDDAQIQSAKLTSLTADHPAPISQPRGRACACVDPGKIGSCLG